MRGISQRAFNLAIRNPCASALKTLAPHSKDIQSAWNREVRRLRIQSAKGRESRLDFAQLSAALRSSSLPKLQGHIQEFVQQLDEYGVELPDALATLDRLFDVCTRRLKSQPSAVMALSRLHSLFTTILAAHFASRRPRGESTAAAPDSDESNRSHNASVYLTKVYEEERKKLSRDLHDEVGHDLVLIKLYLEMIALDSTGREFEGIRPRLKEAITIVSHAIDSVRRLVLDLGPAVFDDLGFLPAVRTYTSQFSARTKIAVTLREGHLPEHIPMSHQVALYRLLQGALSNVLKHASAKSVMVSLGCMKNSVLILVIQDDGVGFDTTARPGNRFFGLTAMRERVEVLGGRIHIQSSKGGPMSRMRGTRIEVDLPLPGGIK